MKKTFFAAVTVSGLVCAAALAAEPLLLQWGTIDTASAERQAEAASLRTRVKAKAQARGAEDRAAYLVQFDGVVQGEWRDWLAATTQVRGYIPENAYLVWATAGEMAEISAHGHVFWTGEWKREYKTEATVKAGVARRAAARASGAADVDGEAGELYQVGSFVEGGAEALAARLEGAGAVVRSAFDRLEGCSAVARLTDAQLDEVSGWAEVEWIELKGRARLFNDMACRTNMMAVTNVWKGTVQGGLGLTGAGQIVAVADTGCDMGSTSNIHEDFAGRILAGYGWTNGSYRSSAPWKDVDSHGTHVCGSVLGDGAKSNGKYRGMAYGAKLVMQGMQEDLGGLPDYTWTMLAQAYTNGARIHSDSWGYGSDYAGKYVYDSVYADGYMWTNQNFLMVIAAGNDGLDGDRDGVIDPGSVTPPGTSKNCLCVGAAENYRTSGGYASKTYYSAWGSDYPVDPIKSDKISGTNVPQGIVAFSGRGPTADGRYKPDIVAPGSDIVSVRSRAASDTGWGVNSANTNYLYMGGTSMATPLTSGAMALVRQWLVERRGMAEPMAALMKAVLVNGARDMTPGQYGTGTYQEVTARPDRSQGFGHVNLYDSLEPGVGRFIDLHTNKLASASANVTTNLSIGTAGGVYRLTLAWQDFPGSSGASKTLVNDLDLTVTTPGGTVLYPNHAGRADHTNNIETIEFTATELGDYSVKVQAYSVTKTSPHGGQPYALVIAGPTTEEPDPVAPAFRTASTNATTVREEDFEFDFAQLLTTTPYPAASWKVVATGASGDEFDFDDGYLYYLPTEPGQATFRATASNAYGSASCTLTVTVVSGPPDVPGTPYAYNLSTTGFTAEWAPTAYTANYRLDVLTGGTVGPVSEKTIDEDFSGWSSHSSYGSYVQEGSGGSWSMIQAIVAPTAAASAPGSKGQVQLKNGAGYLALPPVDGPKTVTVNAKASGTSSSLELQKSLDSGSTWSTVLTWSPGTTVAGLTGEVAEANSGVLLRLFAANRAMYVYDVEVTSAGAAGFTNYVAGWSNVTVLSTNCAVTGLQPGTTYAFQVRAENSYGVSATSEQGYATTVDADVAPSWSGSLPAQSQDVAEMLSFDVRPFVSGTPQPAVSIASATAPAGSYGMTNAVLCYTPQAAGTAVFTLLASNRAGTATAQLSVAGVACAPVFDPLADMATTVGATVDFTATATGIPAPSVALTATTADAADYADEGGYVVFSPHAEGAFTFTFTAANIAGSATKTVTVTVDAAPTTIPALALSDATSNGFLAAWTPCTGVSAYRLQVATDDQFSAGGSGEETTLLENAATAPSSAPDGWTYSLGDKTGSYLKLLQASDSVVSAEFSAARAVSAVLSQKVRTYGGSSAGTTNLVVSYSTDGGTTWTELGRVAGSSSTLAAKTVDASALAGLASVRLKWTAPGAGGGKGVGFSTVLLTGTESSGSGSLVLDETVSATNRTVRGLAPETRYYARVKGEDAWSEVKSIVTTSGGVSPTNAYEQWLVDQGLSPADYPQGGSTAGTPNWESYILDRMPGTGGLEVESVAGDGTTGPVELTFPASSNRFYELVVHTNLLTAPTTNDLGRGRNPMVITNPVGSDAWFGTIRVRLAAPE